MVAKFFGISTNHGPAIIKLWQKKKEKFNMHDFAVHDCTKEQNSNPYFSSVF